MQYQIITKQEYQKERKIIFDMVKELFKNEDSKIANLQEFFNHLDYLFSKDTIIKPSALSFVGINGSLVSFFWPLNINNIDPAGLVNIG